MCFVLGFSPFVLISHVANKYCTEFFQILYICFLITILKKLLDVFTTEFGSTETVRIPALW